MNYFNYINYYNFTKNKNLLLYIINTNNINKMDKNIKKYDKLINNFLEIQNEKEYSNETAHIVQDEIYRTFIKDISNNKFKTIEDAILISKKIKKSVIKHDKDRWYA